MVLFIALVSLSGCYVSRQLYYQGNLLSTRKPISLLLWQNDTPEDLKQSLRQVEDIRSYAERAGLTVGGAYDSYIESPHNAVSYIVQAAFPLQLKLKQWWFPVIGNVPYLGYFYRHKRDEKAQELRTQGYDVATSEAGAFSSLGWYDDPVYSSMLKRPLSALAHLFFHELTHRTIWIANEAKLNEHLAEFVAMTLTRQYLSERKMQNALAEYNARLQDKRLYHAWLKQMRSDLKSLYNSPRTKAEKLEQKHRLFEQYTGAQFPKFATKRYAHLNRQEWNNAVVLGASLYLPETEPFERAYRCGDYVNVGEFLMHLKRLLNQEERSPRKILESLCSASTLERKRRA